MTKNWSNEPTGAGRYWEVRTSSAESVLFVGVQAVMVLCVLLVAAQALAA